MDTDTRRVLDPQTLTSSADAKTSEVVRAIASATVLLGESRVVERDLKGIHASIVSKAIWVQFVHPAN